MLVNDFCYFCPDIHIINERNSLYLIIQPVNSGSSFFRIREEGTMTYIAIVVNRLDKLAIKATNIHGFLEWR